MGLLWLPISYFLSGNWNITFQQADTKQQIWETYTYMTPVLPFLGYFGMRVLAVFLSAQVDCANDLHKKLHNSLFGKNLFASFNVQKQKC